MPRPPTDWATKLPEILRVLREGGTLKQAAAAADVSARLIQMRAKDDAAFAAALAEAKKRKNERTPPPPQQTPTEPQSATDADVPLLTLVPDAVRSSVELGGVSDDEIRAFIRLLASGRASLREYGVGAVAVAAFRALVLAEAGTDADDDSGDDEVGDFVFAHEPTDEARGA